MEFWFNKNIWLRNGRSYRRTFDIIFTEEDLKNGIPKKEIETALKEGRATDNRWHIAKDKSLFYAYGLVFPLIGLDGEMWVTLKFYVT